MSGKNKITFKFELVVMITVVALCIIFVIIEGSRHEYNLDKLIDSDNYSIISELSNEVYLQYNNSTKVVSIAYIDYADRGTNYVREEIPYLYNVETKDLQYIDGIETKKYFNFYELK